MNANELLGDLDALRRRTRADRRGYAFPLFLFGALILLAPLTYVAAPPLPTDDGLFDVLEFAPIDRGPFPQFVPYSFFERLEYPELIGWYWMLTIIGGLLATRWWYRRRAERRGVEGDLRPLFVVTGTALLGFLFISILLAIASNGMVRNGLYSTPSANLSLMAGSAAVAAGVLVWGSRPGRSERARTVASAVGGLFAALAFAALGVYLIHGFSALLVIAVALLVLARTERSVFLGSVGVLFTAISLFVNLYDVGNIYFWWGPGAQGMALQYVLAPGLLLLVAGLVAAFAGRRSSS